MKKRTIILFAIFLSIALASFLFPAFQKELPVSVYYSMVTEPRIWGVTSYVFLILGMIVFSLIKSRKNTQHEIRIVGILLLIVSILLLLDYLYSAFLYPSKDFIREFRFQLTLFLGLTYGVCCGGFFQLKFWARDLLIPISILSIVLLVIDSIYVMFALYWRNDWIEKIIMFYDLPLVLFNLFLLFYLRLSSVKAIFKKSI
jgi:hypothetical protein